MNPIANIIRAHGFAPSLANGLLIPYVDSLIGDFDANGLDVFDKINLMVESGATNDEIADWLERLQTPVFSGAKG